jgi:eukaryotic-like serine/threonine-protein kinase
MDSRNLPDSQILASLLAARLEKVIHSFDHFCRTPSDTGRLPAIDAAAEEIASVARDLARQLLSAIHDRQGTADPEATRAYTPGPGPAGTNPSGERAVPTIPNTAVPTVGGEAARAEKMNGPGAAEGGSLTTGCSPTVPRPPVLPGEDSGAAEESPPLPKGVTAGLRLPDVPGYAIDSVLGRGGMGVVYRATQLGLNRPVALKMILSGIHANAAQLDRFRTEARAVAHVHHPNIVQVYEIGEHDGLPYITLEFCPGGSLDRRLNKEPQPPQKAAALVETLARAMAAAHAAGVIHRDLKPANVLLDANDTAKIADFGLARELEEEGPTRTGSVLGTPSYMSPEQAAGATRLVGPHSDQYSLGAILYDLLTGRPPFKGTSMMETLEHVRTREPAPPTQLQPSLPRDLETICLKALRKEPQQRYPTCEALADDLRAFQEGRPIAARPAAPAERTWRWAKRNPGVATLSAAVVGLLMLLAVGGTAAALLFHRQRNEAESLAEQRRQALDLAEQREQEAKESQQAAEKNARAADENYQLARESLVQLVAEVPSALGQALFARSAQAQVLGLLVESMTRQLNLAATRQLPDRSLMNLHLQLGDLYLAQGNRVEAGRQYQNGLTIAERLEAANPAEKDTAQGNLAVFYSHLGTLARDGERNGPAALDWFARAEKIHRLRVEHPESSEIPLQERQQSLADIRYEIAETRRRMQQFDEALPICEEALELRKTVAAAPVTPYTRGAARKLAESFAQLGQIQTKRGQDQAAEQALTEAANRFLEMTKQKADDLALRTVAARAAQELGDFLLMRNRLDEAGPWYEKGLTLTRSLLTGAEILAAQSQLSDVYYRSATTALKRGDHKTADVYYHKCLDLRLALLEVRPTDARSRMRVANAQARCGHQEPAAKTMHELRAQFRNDPGMAFETVCVLGMCADAVRAGRPAEQLTAEERKLRDQYLDQALTELEDLVGRLKYTDVVALKTDPDLDALRDQPRFQEIIKTLGPGRP